MIDVHILGIKKVIRDGNLLIQETKPNGSQLASRSAERDRLCLILLCRRKGVEFKWSRHSFCLFRKFVITQALSSSSVSTTLWKTRPIVVQIN